MSDSGWVIIGKTTCKLLLSGQSLHILYNVFTGKYKPYDEIYLITALLSTYLCFIWTPKSFSKDLHSLLLFWQQLVYKLQGFDTRWQCRLRYKHCCHHERYIDGQCSQYGWLLRTTRQERCDRKEVEVTQFNMGAYGRGILPARFLPSFRKFFIDFHQISTGTHYTRGVYNWETTFSEDLMLLI